MLSYSAESGIGRILRDVRGAALERWPAQSVFKAHLASVLRTMALDGRGMAWLPHTLIGDDLASGRLVEAAPQEWRDRDGDSALPRPPSAGTAAEEFWTSCPPRSDSALAADSLAFTRSAGRDTRLRTGPMSRSSSPLETIP